MVRGGSPRFFEMPTRKSHRTVLIAGNRNENQIESEVCVFLQGGADRVSWGRSVFAGPAHP